MTTVNQAGQVVPMNKTAIAKTADLIKQEYDASIADAKSAVQHAINCGSYLMDMKEMLHAEKQIGWADWVNNNCPFHKDTANKYIRLAKEESRSAVSNYLKSEPEPSISGALRAIKPKRENVPPTPKAMSKEKLQAQIFMYALAHDSTFHEEMKELFEEHFNCKLTFTKKAVQEWRDGFQVKIKENV